MKHRNLSRRDFLKMTAATMVSATLASCGAKPSPEAVEPTEVKTGESSASTTELTIPKGASDNHDVFVPLMPRDEKLTIGFWDSCESQPTNDIYDEYIKLFNDFYPNVTIDRQHGQSKENYLASAAAGTPPDVWHGGWDPEMLGNYARNGVILPLNDYIDEVKFPVDRFLPGALENATMDDKIWGLPEGFALFILWHHPPQWSEIDHPEDPKDTDDLLGMAEKLTLRDDKGQITRLGLQIQNWWWTQFGWVGAYGGTLWDKNNNQPTPDNPGVISALKDLVGLVKVYGVEQMDAWLGSIGSLSGVQMPYLTGDLAMNIDGNYADQYPAQMKTEWKYGTDYRAIAIPPAPSDKLGGQPVVALWAYPLVISAASKNPRWAFELIRFTQSREYIVPMNAESRDLPAVKEYIKDSRFTNGSAQAVRAIMEGDIPTAAILPMHPVVGEYANKFTTAIEEVVHLIKTPEEAMGTLKDEMKALIAETL